MLTLATAYFVKVLLSSMHNVEGEFYPIGMWFIALLLDFALLMVILGVLAPCG